MTARHATIVTDLTFGDAGKGSIVDYLARQEPAGLVVRFNGGAQAAHNVITPDGRHHRFSQFGSATLAGPARTHLSRFMLIDPLGLVEEAGRLANVGVPNAQSRLTIDEAALIVTPYHQAANRLREIARGAGRHGSCGQGIGETMADSLNDPATALRAADLRSRRTARTKLEAAHERKLVQLAALLPDLLANPAAVHDLATLHDPGLSDAILDFYASFTAEVSIVDGNYLAKQLRTIPHVIFEGAQGVLLDEWRGFHPYTTWSTTTFANADELLTEAGYDGITSHLGLLRAYTTRHGAGPFVTEDAGLTAAIPDDHNGANPWQQGFRVGWFDLVAARYALEVAGPTSELAVTCLDRLPSTGPRLVATAYQHAGTTTTRLMPGPFTDLNYQQTLTSTLLQSRPVYQDISRLSLAGYIDFLEDQLRIPVTITSTGPKATDKTARLRQAA